MKISYNWLQNYLSKKLPKPEKLAEILTLHSFETNVSFDSPKNQPILEVDVLPNRAHDCFGHIGIARECAAILNYKLKLPIYQLKTKQQSKINIKKYLEVKVENSELCPRYCTRVILGVKVGPSPKWIQERLETCGIRPINNIVDATNYVMLEYNQPLHIFDYDKLEGVNNKQQLIIRTAKKDESIITLDNQKRGLSNEVLVIADSKKPIDLAGIMGETNTAVSDITKNIIIESANFDASNIYKSVKKLKLKTEASDRFEKGIDPNLAGVAIDRVAWLIQKIAGGKILSGLIDIYPKQALPKQIILDIDYLDYFLGIKISLNQILKILQSLEFSVKKMSVKKLLITVPTFRLDISIMPDLAEEIARIYGYDKLPASIPTGVLAPPNRNDELFYANQVRQILAGVGLNEVYNYSFISDKDALIFKFPASDLVELQNPLSAEQKYLRPRLIPNLLKNIKNNLRFFDEVRIFELGKVFKPRIEQKNLAVAIARSNFYESKGIVDLLFNQLGLTDVWYDDYITEEISEKNIFNPNRRAQIKVANALIGWLGEINSEILESYNIQNPVTVFELNFEKLAVLAIEERVYITPSKYPAIVRDIALLVDYETKIERVLNVLEAAGGFLARDIDLFDLYESDELPEGKKSLAFHIVYQSNERTLSDGEVNKLQDKIIKAAEAEGWEVRK